MKKLIICFFLFGSCAAFAHERDTPLNGCLVGKLGDAPTMVCAIKDGKKKYGFGGTISGSFVYGVYRLKKISHSGIPVSGKSYPYSMGKHGTYIDMVLDLGEKGKHYTLELENPSGAHFKATGSVFFVRSHFSDRVKGV